MLASFVLASAILPAVVGSQGTLSVRVRTAGGGTFAELSVLVQLKTSGGSLLAEQNAVSSPTVSFGTRTYASYQIQVWKGGLVIGEQTISFGPTSPAPIDVPVFAKQTITVQTYYAGSPDLALPVAGNVVRAFDASTTPRTNATPVATGTTNASGLATLSLYPTAATVGKPADVYYLQLRNSAGDDIGNTGATGVSVAVSGPHPQAKLYSILPRQGTLSVRVRTASGGTFAELPVRVQLKTSGGSLLQEVDAVSSATVSFGTRTYASYLVQVWKGGLVIGEQTIAFGPTSPSPIDVPVFAKQTITVQTYYAGSPDLALPVAGNVVRAFDASTTPRTNATPVATGTTNASGQATLSLYPTAATVGKPADVYYLQLRNSAGDDIGNTGATGVTVALTGPHPQTSGIL